MLLLRDGDFIFITSGFRCQIKISKFFIWCLADFNCFSGSFSMVIKYQVEGCVSVQLTTIPMQMNHFQIITHCYLLSSSLFFLSHVKLTTFNFLEKSLNEQNVYGFGRHNFDRWCLLLNTDGCVCVCMLNLPIHSNSIWTEHKHEENL